MSIKHEEQHELNKWLTTGCSLKQYLHANLRVQSPVRNTRRPGTIRWKTLWTMDSHHCTLLTLVLAELGVQAWEKWIHFITPPWERTHHKDCAFFLSIIVITFFTAHHLSNNTRCPFLFLCLIQCISFKKSSLASFQLLKTKNISIVKTRNGNTFKRNNTPSSACSFVFEEQF